MEDAFFGTQATPQLGNGDEIDLESWVGETLTTPVALRFPRRRTVYDYDFRRMEPGRLAA